MEDSNFLRSHAFAVPTCQVDLPGRDAYLAVHGWDFSIGREVLTPKRPVGPALTVGGSESRTPPVQTSLRRPGSAMATGPTQDGTFPALSNTTAARTPVFPGTPDHSTPGVVDVTVPGGAGDSHW